MQARRSYFFGNLEFLKSENPYFRTSGNSDFRKPAFQKSGTSKNPEFQISDVPDFSKNRKIQKSGKKAPNVEFAYVEFPLKSMVIRKSSTAEGVFGLTVVFPCHGCRLVSVSVRG